MSLTFNVFIISSVSSLNRFREFVIVKILSYIVFPIFSICFSTSLLHAKVFLYSFHQSLAHSHYDALLLTTVFLQLFLKIKLQAQNPTWLILAQIGRSRVTILKIKTFWGKINFFKTFEIAKIINFKLQKLEEM
jgi:hypothetical protein